MAAPAETGPQRRVSAKKVSGEAKVCALCDAFATDDPAELRAHTEVCFARASRVTVEETTVAEETAYQRWLAVQALPIVQTSAVLMTLNSLGSAVRVGLVLLGPRFARVKSSLSALPLLYALPSTGLPPLLPSDVPEDALRSMAALVLPAMVLVRLPYHLAFFYVTTTPSWRDWYLARHERLWTAAILVETLVGLYLEAVIWMQLQRIVVWPAAPLLTALLGDFFAFGIGTLRLHYYLGLMGTRLVYLNWVLLALRFNKATMWHYSVQLAMQIFFLLGAPVKDRIFRAQARQAHHRPPPLR